MFDDTILKNLGDFATISTLPNARARVFYHNCVDPDSVQLPEDNDPLMPDETFVFEKSVTDQWIHGSMQNLTSLEGSFPGKKSLCLN